MNRKTFLESLIEFLIDQYGKNLSGITIIFPHRRPIEHFRIAFKQFQSIIAPPQNILPFNKFVYELVDLKHATNHELYFRLYLTYKNVCKENSIDLNFGNFLPKARSILQDFNDADNALVNVKELFKNVSEAKFIESWIPDGGKVTKSQQKYLHMLEQLPQIYESFTAELLEYKLAYDGLARRRCVDIIKSSKIHEHEERIYIFAGFNALTKAEKHIVKYHIGKKGYLVMDADPYYINEKTHQAGKFIRENRSFFGQQAIVLDQNDSMLDSEKHIFIYGMPSAMAEHSWLSTFLSERYNTSMTDIAIVPNNQQLLTDLVNKIPQDIDLSIAIPLPLNIFPIISFFQSFFQLQMNVYDFFLSTEQILFAIHDVVDIIQHPIIKTYLSGKDVQIIHNIKKELYTTKSYHRTKEEILDIVKNYFNENTDEFKLFEDFFTPLWQVKEPVRLIENIFNKLIAHENIKRQNQCIINELCTFIQIVENFNRISLLQANEIYLLFRIFCQQISIPVGSEQVEPLQDVNSHSQNNALSSTLQKKTIHILGLLETRCLDFDTIILTQCNEGYLPQSPGQYLSLIPYDIRKSAIYRLSDPLHGEHIQAYNFYRLLQRAKNIYLLYSINQIDAQTGEPSRFIQQILHELRPIAQKWNIEQKIFNYPLIQLNQPKFQEIRKTKNHIDKLKKENFIRISHSALKAYLTCPARFYFQHILNINADKMDIELSIPANTFGSIIHKTLEDFYKKNNLVQKVINHNDIKKAAHEPEKILQENFKSVLGKNFMQGKNIILYSVALKMVENVIEFDKKNESQLMILSLEQYHERIFSINGEKCKYYGIFDRVDIVNKKLRIIDYKTGKLDQLPQLTIDVFENTENMFQQLTDEQFQLLSYLLIFFGSKVHIPENIQYDEVVACIKPLQNRADAFFELSLKHEQNAAYSLPSLVEDKFHDFVEVTLTELIHPDIPFRRRRTPDNCQFCPYDEICQHYED